MRRQWPGRERSMAVGCSPPCASAAGGTARLLGVRGGNDPKSKACGGDCCGQSCVQGFHMFGRRYFRAYPGLPTTMFRKLPFPKVRALLRCFRGRYFFKLPPKKARKFWIKNCLLYWLIRRAASAKHGPFGLLHWTS